MYVPRSTAPYVMPYVAKEILPKASLLIERGRQVIEQVVTDPSMYSVLRHLTGP